MQMRRTLTLWGMVGILLLATALRLFDINTQSLWIDEGFTWNLTQYGDLFAILRRDVHPPLYFLMVDMWVDLAGTSVFSMRYFSLLPSVLSVVVVYQLARTLTHLRGVDPMRIALIAGVLMAIAEAETFLSQEARSYTWHILFASLSMLGFLRWAYRHNQRDLALWLLSTIALIYTFYLGAFVGVVQGLYALIFLRGHRRVVAIGGLVFCALALMPWLLLTGGEQADNISRAEWIRPSDFGFWLEDFRTKYFTGQWALTMALFLAGVVVIERDKVHLHPTGILLMLWFVVPLLLTLILNERVPTYQPRRVTQIVPAIALLMAFGIGHLRGHVRQAVLVILIVYGVFSVDFWRYKQPWREMVADTAHLIAPGTPMLFELGGDDYAPRYHYAEALPNSFDFLLDEGTPSTDANVLYGLTTWRDLQADQYASGLPAVIDSVDHWWFFYWSSDSGALDWLQNFGFTRTARIGVVFNPDVYLYRYDRLPDEPLARYDNGLILRDAILHDDLRVELLWETREPITAALTTSAFLLDEDGQLVAQFDSQPFFGQRPMPEWEIGATVYDPKPMTADRALPAGDYTVGVVVYQIVDGMIEQLPTVVGDQTIGVGTISLNNG
ncbi:MAG: glycosyltransferase family 39 protein [Anaerolineae bacterium]